MFVAVGVGSVGVAHEAADVCLTLRGGQESSSLQALAKANPHGPRIAQ